MSHYYQVTLNQGRTDTLTIQADSVTDIKTFFETVSTATITIIKKIVYSKELGIGAISSTYQPNNQNKFLKVLVKNEDNFTSSLNISFPIKGISKDTIIKSIKKNLLINDKLIVEVINILLSE